MIGTPRRPKYKISTARATNIQNPAPPHMEAPASVYI
jgi:hypothetical protein